MIKKNCKFYLGVKPCIKKNICSECSDYKSLKEKIIIIKTQALGDVFRTESILYGIKKKYPDSEIYWVTKRNTKDFFLNNTLVDKFIFIEDIILTLGLQTIDFDILYNFDKERESCFLANLFNATQKFGFYLNKKDKLDIFNKSAEYALMLGIDDNLKFRKNNKTYMQIIYEIADLKYDNEKYNIYFSENEKQKIRTLKNNLFYEPKKIIGINTGASNIFANKFFNKTKIIELIELINSKYNVNILILGGEQEDKKNKEIKSYFQNNENIIYPGYSQLREFIYYINVCDIIILGDTSSMHIAIASNIKSIVIFGSTSSVEIDLFDLGKKIKPDEKNFDCSPCYKSKCDKDYTCMDNINLKEIIGLIDEI